MRTGRVYRAASMKYGKRRAEAVGLGALLFATGLCPAHILPNRRFARSGPLVVKAFARPALRLQLVLVCRIARGGARYAYHGHNPRMREVSYKVLWGAMGYA
jgi:hypothetical protein